MGRFDNQTMIVTGAATGIGRAEALLLAGEGANVVVNDLGTSIAGEGSSHDAADAVVDEIARAGGTAIANYEDVSSWAGAKSMVAAAVETFGDLDGLINNAGITRHGSMFDQSEDDWDAVVRVNLKGTYCPIHFAAEHWQARWRASGVPCNVSIVNTTSRAGVWGEAGKVTYSATKAGVIGLTLALSRELREIGVRVNAVAPLARTRMWDTAMSQFDPNLLIEENRKQSDQGGPLSPIHAAVVTVWLASRLSEGINGQLVIAQGGMIELVSEGAVSEMVETDEPWTIDSVSSASAKLFGESAMDIGPLPPFRRTH